MGSLAIAESLAGTHTAPALEVALAPAGPGNMAPATIATAIAEVALAVVTGATLGKVALAVVAGATLGKVALAAISAYSAVFSAGSAGIPVWTQSVGICGSTFVHNCRFITHIVFRFGGIYCGQ